jgi:hypothetical protein
MTVVLGLERYFSTKPRPRPCGYVRRCKHCMLRITCLVGAGDEYSSSHVEGDVEGVQAVDLEDDK